MKNSLPYLKSVLRLSCVVHGPICGRFMVETIVFFFPTQILINYFECYATVPMLADAHISSLGYLCLLKEKLWSIEHEGCDLEKWLRA